MKNVFFCKTEWIYGTKQSVANKGSVLFLLISRKCNENFIYDYFIFKLLDTLQ